MRQTVELIPRQITLKKSDKPGISYESVAPVHIKFSIAPPPDSDVKFKLRINRRFGGVFFSLPSGQQETSITNDNQVPFDVFLHFYYDPFIRRPYVMLELDLCNNEHQVLTNDFDFFELKQQTPSL